jgi:uncharacterized membrane protein
MRAEAVSAVTTAPGAVQEPGRLLPFDWLRGLVMVLMTIDHASGVFNAGRLQADGLTYWHPGTALPLAQFLTRWVTHLCAPTFVFLAGFVLLLSVRGRTERGEPQGSVTAFVLMRGLIIAAFDPLWMRLVFVRPDGRIGLGVLYAIGMSFVVLAFLRWVPAGALGLVGVGLAILTEPAIAAIGQGAGPLGTLLLSGGPVGPFWVRYPVVPWLAIMMMGWGAASVWHRAPERFSRRLALAGVVGLLLFVVLRGLNGFGNLALLREGHSVVQWLHVSKYPPSLTFDGLELGLSWLLLAAFLTWPLPPWADALLRPLGQSAFFFYLLHVHLLALIAVVLGMYKSEGLAATYLGASAVVAVLHPLCRMWRGYKVAHPRSLAQYI